MATEIRASSSDASSPTRDVANEKPLETVRTVSRVPGNDNYYEKDGLRTMGDGYDHEAQGKISGRQWLALTAMAFLWTGSQIPVYLFGGVPPLIYSDIGGVDRWIWFVLANLLSLAAICPFVGSLSDIIGRRYVAIAGASFLIVGMIICSTAKTMNVFIGGMVFAGIGAGINELTALAATSEMAPTAKRGKYVAVMIFTIIPFVPSILYAQLIAHYASWRYIGIVCGVWAFIGLVLTLFFYFPPPRVNSTGLSRTEIAKRIDFVGGLLSISGMLLFMMGLQWGGYQYSWHSPHVLVTLILGIALMIAFCVWEKYFAKYPMVPGRIKKDPRVLILTLIITFISGANFFSVLLFWPTQAFNMYGNDPVGVGLRGLPIGCAILTGAVVVLFLLSYLRGRNRELMIASSIIMTAGCGSLSVATPDNLSTIWGLLVLAGLGIGGIVVPASIITTIICPDDLIATVTALTLAIRVIGGSVGYCTYYNVFIKKAYAALSTQVPYVAVEELNIFDTADLTNAATWIANAQLFKLRTIPQIGNNVTAYNIIVRAGQEAFSQAYKWVYYVSIAFGGVSIIAACFLGDISKYMDDHVAVVY